jgi:hypothetical protein
MIPKVYILLSLLLEFLQLSNWNKCLSYILRTLLYTANSNDPFHSFCVMQLMLQALCEGRRLALRDPCRRQKSKPMWKFDKTPQQYDIPGVLLWR